LRSFSEIPEMTASSSLHAQGEPIRVLVAEPDATSRHLICSLLACEPEITAKYIDGSCLVSSVREIFPDAVILDANTPAIRQAGGWSGLEVQAPAVTIVTAYDSASLTPFAPFATDLLVKPFDVERFESALDLATSTILRTRQNLTTISGMTPLKTTTPGFRVLQRLAVEVNEKILLVRVSDIQWIQSCGKHVRLHVGETSHLLRQSMRSLEASLDPNCFLRVHRNAIVNLDHVAEFYLPPAGNMFVRLSNGRSLPLRRGNRSILRRRLKDISSGARYPPHPRT
jgi:two-component system, LytTR family, response regulator